MIESALLLLTLINTSLISWLLVVTLAKKPEPQATRYNRTPRPIPQSSLTPIKHPKPSGPRVPVSSKVSGMLSSGRSAPVSYWQHKNAPDAEPFIAMFFRESGIFDGEHIPADSYLILDDSKVVPSKDFESIFEQAKVAIEVNRPIEHRAANAPKPVVPFLTSEVKMSEEEARQLAEEYDLVEKPRYGVRE